MNIMLTLLAVSFLFASCKNELSENKIEVTGQATMKIVPDMVELTLRASNVRPAMKNAVAETQLAVAQILTVCHKYISDSSDIKVSNISTDKSYEYRNNRNVFAGYQADQVLEVTLKNISAIEKFTEELLATKISKIDNVMYNHSKADSILREVNLMALEDARKSAEKMCSKMNVQLGKIIYLSNYRVNMPSGGLQHNNEYEMNLYSKSFGGRGFKMTTEILQFQDMAFAAFALD
jgi:uncharacterized protein YggE